MNYRLLPLKHAQQLLIAEHGEVEFAERLKSIYEEYDQEVYGKAVEHLERFLEELLEIKKKEINDCHLEAYRLAHIMQSSRQDNHQ